MSSGARSRRAARAARARGEIGGLLTPDGCWHRCHVKVSGFVLRYLRFELSLAK